MNKDNADHQSSAPEASERDNTSEKDAIDLAIIELLGPTFAGKSQIIGAFKLGWQAARQARPCVPEWFPIETCPKFTDVLFYREDAGVFYGQYTYCAEWVSEEEQEKHQYDDDTLYSEDVWSFDHDGAYRCDGDLKPTHWMPLPAAPSVQSNGEEG